MKNIIILLIISVAMLFSFASCEETVWPEVQNLSKAEYAGVWNTGSYRIKTTYTRIQNTQTNDYTFKDTTYTDSTQMTFEFGITNPSGTLIEDSVKISSVQTVKGVVKPAVVKSGYFTVAQTPGSDYADKVTYLNVWEKATNIHSTSMAEPYTTYTVVRKGGNDMEVEWTSFNNTAQNSVKYKVLLSK